jgi:ABC-2 type transport system permease protein/sodium transport system permease protein
VRRLARKELSEILRDRRTIITLTFMPLLLYPLMSIAFQQFLLASKLNPASGPEYRLGFTTKEAAGAFLARLQRGEEVLQFRRARSGPATTDVARPEREPKLVVSWGTPEELEAALHAGQVDVVFRVVSLADPKREGDTSAEAVYAPNSAGALGALSYIEQRLAAANSADLRWQLRIKGVPVQGLVLSLTRLPLHAPARDSLVSLPSLVPLILILMTITGAVYPAIDLTAGERERNTLEILVAAPVPRFELLSAKYVAVVTVAVLTALVNLVAMTLTLLLSGLAPLVFEGGVSPLLLLMLFALLLLFAAFFSAVLLCLTSFARSFKEAQAYLIPLMLASLAPGILAMLPGLKLNLLMSAIPLLNVVLLARDLMNGQADFTLALVIVGVTVVYAVAALSLAARVFGSENVLYSEQSGWTDLFRRPDEAHATADLAAALWCLAVMVPLHFMLQAVLPFIGEPGGAVFLLAMTLGFILVFGAVPLLFAYLGHVDAWSGFGLRRPRVAALLAGLVLGGSLWPWILELLWTARAVLPEMVQAQASRVVLKMREAGPLGAMPLIVAAVCEELFFRGFLFQSLRRVCGPGLTITVTSLLFGLTHAALGGAVGLGQLLPATLLGVVLGVVCWLSGSVWPGLLLHVCHNALLATLAQAGLTPDASSPSVPLLATTVVGLRGTPDMAGVLLAMARSAQSEAVPARWLLGGAVGTGVGFLLLLAGRNPMGGQRSEQVNEFATPAGSSGGAGRGRE